MVTRFQYDPDDFSSGFGFVRLVMAFQGTTWPMVLKSGLFWTVVIFHLSMHTIEHLMHYNFAASVNATSSREEDEINHRVPFVYEEYMWDGLHSSYPGHNGLPRLGWGVGTVTSSLCVFFLVFYTNSQCALPTRALSLHARQPKPSHAQPAGACHRPCQCPIHAPAVPQTSA